MKNLSCMMKIVRKNWRRILKVVHREKRLMLCSGNIKSKV